MFVLNSSALLTLLFDEPGRERVAELIGAQTCACAVNLSEVVSVLCRSGMPEQVAVLRQLPVQAVDFDIDFAAQAGGMAVLTRPYGLSLGDHACLATGQQRRATIVAADQAWGRLPAECGFAIELVRPVSTPSASAR